MALVHIDWNPPRSILRNFGIVGLFVFGVLALQAWFWNHILFFGISATVSLISVIVMIILAAYCGIFAMFEPQRLRPLYLVLSVVGFPIGLVVSYVVLGVIYFLIVTPIAIVFRLKGRDAMCRELDRSAATYWTPREKPEGAGRYFRQY